MMVYAHVLNELVKKDQGFDNGTLVTQLMWNRTFQGRRLEFWFKIGVLKKPTEKTAPILDSFFRKNFF